MKSRKRRNLKPLAEQFSHQAPHSFRFLVVFGAGGGGGGQLPELSEDSRSALLRIVEDLNDKAEKVTVKVFAITPLESSNNPLSILFTSSTSKYQESVQLSSPISD